MAFDDALAARVRALISGNSGLTERKMFGGLAFLINGNMSVGIHGSELIARMSPDDARAALCEPGVRVFDLSGKPMKGWLLVSVKILGDENALASWVEKAVAFARSLPAK